MKRWEVFDFAQNEVVAYWYGESMPTQWPKKYSDVERYEISCEIGSTAASRYRPWC